MIGCFERLSMFQDIFKGFRDADFAKMSVWSVVFETRRMNWSLMCSGERSCFHSGHSNSQSLAEDLRRMKKALMASLFDWQICLNVSRWTAGFQWRVTGVSIVNRSSVSSRKRKSSVVLIMQFFKTLSPAVYSSGGNWFRGICVMLLCTDQSFLNF